jgi:hypothetical protein
LVALPATTSSTEANVVSSAATAAYGRTVTFTATVKHATSPGGPTPTGSVQFEVNGALDGKPVPLSSTGAASITESTLGFGSYTTNAEYLPTGDFTGITSSSDTQTITADVTSVSVKSSAITATPSKALTFTATVANQSAGSTAVPLGTVIFKIDGQTKASVKLSGGKAVLSGIKLAAGTHTVSVYYTPLDTDFAKSQGQLSRGEKISK